MDEFLERKILSRLKYEILEDCPICLEKIGERCRIKKTTKCGHNFHWWCIDAWLEGHDNCPMCRTVLIERESLIFFSRIYPSQTTTKDILLFSILIIYIGFCLGIVVAAIMNPKVNSYK